VNTALRSWPAARAGGPRRAGVSAFGIGGTNAHAVIEEAPPTAPSGPSRPWQVLVLSAHSRSALESASVNLAGQLDRRSLVILFTDFVDPTSAELMLRSVGHLIERHLVLFVLPRDTELEEFADAPPDDSDAVARAVTAAALLRDRRLVIARLERMGAHIVVAPYDQLGAALVNAYLDIKQRDLL